MGVAGEFGPTAARILVPVVAPLADRAVPGVGSGPDLVAFRDLTGPEMSDGDDSKRCLWVAFDRAELPASAVAALGVSGHEVLVSVSSVAPTAEAVQAVHARCAELLSAGVPADRLVVETSLTHGVVDRIANLRTGGVQVGIVVAAPSASTGADLAAERGATIGLLAAAITKGVAIVLTGDPATARRVRAVVAALEGSSSGDGRMAE